MRVKQKEMLVALTRYATQHWRYVLSGAREMLRQGTIASYNGVLIVDDNEWRKVLNQVARLPYGGRWVAQEKRVLYYWLSKATNFNQ